MAVCIVIGDSGDHVVPSVELLWCILSFPSAIDVHIMWCFPE